MIDVVQKQNPATGRETVEADFNRKTAVRVRAATEDIRRTMRHGVTKVGFLPDIGMSVEWPNDSFTKRRIRDGDVIVEEASEAKPMTAAKADRRAKPPAQE
jgi:hypothetical protein